MTLAREKIGPDDVPVKVGSRVWAGHNNRTYDAILEGPGPYPYEVVVTLVSDGSRLTIHRYNVKPQTGVAKFGGEDA